MSGKDRYIELQPLLEIAAVRRTHNGRRAEPERGAVPGQLAGERSYARYRRRGMTQERIEDDIGGPGRRRGSHVVRLVNTHGQHERRIRRRVRRWHTGWEAHDRRDSLRAL